MKGLILFLVLLTAFIVGVTFYLQPNDFSGCEAKPSGSCKAADAIVVVSGGDTQARVAHGVELLKSGWADKIVFSGAALDKSGPSNAETMKQQAVQSGVSSGDIFVDEDAANTQQNAANTKSILAKNDFKEVILVTSGYHQRRALLEFQSQVGSESGMKVLSWPVSKDKDWGTFWWLTPRGWWLAGGELVKVVAFYLGAGR